MAHLPKKLTNPKKESSPYVAPVKALSKVDRWKIDNKLTKRKRESTTASEKDHLITGRRSTDDEEQMTMAADANKRQRPNPETTSMGEEMQKILYQMGRQE